MTHSLDLHLFQRYLVGIGIKGTLMVVALPNLICLVLVCSALSNTSTLQQWRYTNFALRKCIDLPYPGEMSLFVHI